MFKKIENFNEKQLKKIKKKELKIICDKLDLKKGKVGIMRLNILNYYKEVNKYKEKHRITIKDLKEGFKILEKVRKKKKKNKEQVEEIIRYVKKNDIEPILHYFVKYKFMSKYPPGQLFFDIEDYKKRNFKTAEEELDYLIKRPQKATLLDYNEVLTALRNMDKKGLIPFLDVDFHNTIFDKKERKIIIEELQKMTNDELMNILKENASPKTFVAIFFDILPELIHLDRRRYLTDIINKEYRIDRLRSELRKELKNLENIEISIYYT